MRRPVFGANMAIFLLFFGIATLDAIRFHAWLSVAFWVAVATVFLFVDVRREQTPIDSSSR